VEWLKDDESENDVDGESPLKDLLLGVQEAHHMEVTRLKDEGETSLQVAADEYKENWQNSSKEHQIKMAKKEEEIQQLKNLLEEKLVHVQKLSADLRENKKESQSMQAYIHSLHRNKTAEVRL
jgi:chromosome segregation ATPase